MADVLRILDANANRAREALRVMEEAARFGLEDPALTEALKHLRHDLVTALLRFDSLPFWRDVKRDVGTDLSASREMTRHSVADVAAAAGARLSEALRALEEYGKVVDPAFAAGIERLRYRGYELDQQLRVRLSGGRASQWRLMLLLTESLCARGWRETLRDAIAGGVDCVQVREKSMTDAALLARVREVIDLCRRSSDVGSGERGVAVIVNDRPDIALLAGADGVHLGQDDLPCREVRRMAGARLLIGVSTSRLEEARQALDDGADYCGAGPMFPTSTKHKDRIVGPGYLSEVLAWGKLPVLAIGGISASNVSQLAETAGKPASQWQASWGVAVSSAICSAPDAAAAARAILSGMMSTGPTPERLQACAKGTGHA